MVPQSAEGGGDTKNPPEAFGLGDDHRSNGRRDAPETEAREKTPAKRAPEEGDKPGSEDGRASKGKSVDEGEKKRNSDENDQGDAKEEDEKPKGTPVYKRPVFIVSTVVILLALIIGGVIFWRWYRQYQSTDDAYVDGHATLISPQVAAPVLRLDVDDNQLVRKGDLMVELDPKDFKVALDQANAQAAAALGRWNQAKAQVISAAANVRQQGAAIEASQVALENAIRDYERYATVDPGARSQQQMDNVTATKLNDAAQLKETQAVYASALAGVATSEAAERAAKGDYEQALAAVEKAQVNLSYCRIYAPIDGRVTQRTVENGAYLAVGQALFSLVSPDVWITANYKETQLTDMRPGQEVWIHIDAFPDQKWKGRVDSIQAGSGARFSVLPAENATGNFVKIVQRVPVKIVFEHDANRDDGRLLSPGISAEPWVKVR